MQYLIQVLAAAATISILNTTPAYAGDQYELTDLGSVFGDSTYPFSINDVGQVVGMSSGEGLFAVPFLWENGEIHELPTFGGKVSESGARGLRNDGVIAGWSATTEFHQPPFDSCQIIRPFVLEMRDLVYVIQETGRGTLDHLAHEDLEVRGESIHPIDVHVREDPLEMRPSHQ